jgi:hypothetical protein
MMQSMRQCVFARSSQDMTFRVAMAAMVMALMVGAVAAQDCTGA